MPRALNATIALAASLFPTAASWLVVSVVDYGAVGDNATDCTAAFRGALAATAAAGGGEVVVPAGLFKTLPVNLTSNTRLTVNGEMWAIENISAWPIIPVVPTYASTFPATRYQPFVFAAGPDRMTNISIAGSGEINGAGPYWWCSPGGQGQCPNYDERRPHVVSFTNVSGVEISGVTLRNSAFWSLRPVYCDNVHFHDMAIITPWCGGDVKGGPGGPNTDGEFLSEIPACLSLPTSNRSPSRPSRAGIDVDSSTNVMIERCHISVGDDHVTVLAGAGASGLAAALPSHNVTVRDNVLGTGMGLSVGSSVSGGVSGVLFTRNVMTERLQDWGIGCHLKTRVEYGGFIRDIAYIDNSFPIVTNLGIQIETDYQSSGKCNATTCTEIRDIVWRNITMSAGSPGALSCMPDRPCVNITLEDVNITGRNGNGWGCNNVSSGTFINVNPPGLAKACGLSND